MKIGQVPHRYRNRLKIDDNGCWLWTGAKHRAGYGMLNICGKVTTAHRFLFELLVGPVPEGLELHHKCESKACCNPDHLAILSPLDHKFQHWRSHCLRGHELTPENTIRGKSGLRQCRQCRDEANRRWRAENRDKIATRIKTWRDENKERIKATKKAWEDQNREQVRAMKRASYHRNKEQKYGL